MLPEPYQFINASPIIPVMVIQRLEDAVPLAEALVEGGVTALEITLRTECALSAIELIAREVPGATVGAGTVCDAGQFRSVVDAGARFVVSPGTTDELLASSVENSTPLLPGAVTASEVMRIRATGTFPVIKFFPASTSGGAGAIKAFGGPFGDMLFVPTGGIGLDTMGDYLSLPNVPAVGGSWIMPNDAIIEGDWPRITQLAREAVARAGTFLAK